MHFRFYGYLNKIKAIQNDLFKNLNNLEQLWLHQNEIDKIEMNSLDSLINLKEIIMYSNHINSIQDGLFKNLNKLEKLWLHENELKIENN